MLLSSGEVLIEMRGKVWYFDPSLLSLHNELVSLPWSSFLPQTDDQSVLTSYLQQHPDQVSKQLVCLEERERWMGRRERSYNVLWNLCYKFMYNVMYCKYDVRSTGTMILYTCTIYMYGF